MPFYLKIFKLPPTKKASFSRGANNLYQTKKTPIRSMVYIQLECQFFVPIILVKYLV